MLSPPPSATSPTTFQALTWAPTRWPWPGSTTRSDGQSGCRASSKAALARLQFDEPVAVRDPETGIELHYRFEHLGGGRLRLSGSTLNGEVLSVGCEPGDINRVSTIMLDGLKTQLT